MTNWVDFAFARELPKVQKVYTQTDQFKKAVVAEAVGSAVWAKRSSGESTGDLTILVNTDAVPGVPAYPVA